MGGTPPYAIIGLKVLRLQQLKIPYFPVFLKEDGCSALNPFKEDLTLRCRG
jgi:hypothetical protein